MMGSHTSAVPKWACIALIGLGAAAGTISAIMSARYGQRMTVDEEGWWAQGGSMYVISAIAFTLFMVAGSLVRAKTIVGIITGLVVAAAACAYVSYTVSNSIGFTGYQMLGKSKQVEVRQRAAADISSIQNDTIISERKELKDQLWRTYTTTRSKEVKDEALAKLEELGQKPVALTVPSVEIPIADARSTILNRLFGIDSETAQAMSAAALPILLVIGEMIGPLLGTALWPRSPENAGQNGRTNQSGKPGNSPLNPRQYTKEEAREHLKALLASGKGFASNKEAAEAWGRSEQVAHKWLKAFRSEGIVRRQQQGRSKAVIAPAPHVNGRALGNA